MRAATCTMYNFYCDFTDVSATTVAHDIASGDYSNLLPKQDDLIAHVFKLRTAGEKNVCDAKKGIEAFRARPLCEGWSAYGKDE
jgi:hypothetical protein